MEEKYYKCYNADAIVEFNPTDRMRNAIKRTDDIIRHIVELRNGAATDYVEALIKRLLEVVNGYTVDTKSLSLKKIEKELTQLKQGKVKTKIIETNLPSPFALNLILQGHTDLIKIEDKQAFLRRMHDLHVKEILGGRNQN